MTAELQGERNEDGSCTSGRSEDLKKDNFGEEQALPS
jgi:hypothetical protein